MQTWEISDVSELETVLDEVLDDLRTADTTTATILALHGELGAGKTTFTQLLARQLGVSEVVTSPTFVVMKGYETTDGTFTQLIHIDAYRIEDEDEMRPLHFTEVLASPHTIVCIEWAEHIPNLLPPHTKHLTITHQGEKRTISYG